MSEIKNGPEKEMLFAVLEFKKEHNGTQYYGAFLGLNSLSAAVKDGKIYLNLQKWPKKDNHYHGQTKNFSNDDISF